MSEETWIVAIDGQQIEGEHGAEQIRTLLRANPGKQVVVWNDTMTAWADPATLPVFRAPQSATPAPMAATATAAAVATATRPAPHPAPSAAGTAASAAAAEFAVRGPEVKNALRNDAKFFKGLLDFGFTEFITPKIVRTLYILSVALVALGFLGLAFSAIGSILTGIRLGSALAILMGIVFLAVTPVIALLQVTLARVFFELVLVLFRIKEGVVNLDERKG
jgi:hypothetical protein